MYSIVILSARPIRIHEMIKGKMAMMSAILRPYLDWEIGVNVWIFDNNFSDSYLSIKSAAGNGEAIVPSVLTTTIQELSSGVIGIGEFAPSKIGSVGDVQPNVVAADRSMSVAKWEMEFCLRISTKNFNVGTFLQKY